MMGLMLVWPALGAGALATGIYFARRHVRAAELRRTDAGEMAELRQRVVQLEQALELTQRDVTRLEESHEFTSNLLTSRTPSVRDNR